MPGLAVLHGEFQNLAYFRVVGARIVGAAPLVNTVCQGLMKKGHAASAIV
jgi:hypothetical protein